MLLWARTIDGLRPKNVAFCIFFIAVLLMTLKVECLRKCFPKAAAPLDGRIGKCGVPSDFHMFRLGLVLLEL